MTEHLDVLNDLNKNISLQEKLVATHKSINSIFPFIVRIAITIYDSETSVLKTYMHSCGDDNPLKNYQANLDDAPSLKEILNKGLPRVINNMLTFENGQHEHTRKIGRHGYAASYTMPMFNEGVFFGFIFFNSDKKDVFNQQVLNHMDIFGHMISLMILNELTSIRTLSAVVKTSGRMTHMRDTETGSHLDRMSRYSRLIARELANKYDLNSSYIEHIFMFSPLHDIGKIAIPDKILLKPEKLDINEKSAMESHASKGREMIDDMLENFGLENIDYIDMLRNIAELHHEKINGRGYPLGIKGDEIPLEARIVAVADIFDALTSERPYKMAWDNNKAIQTLIELADESLDKDCVMALINNMDQVEKIQKQFIEVTY